MRNYNPPETNPRHRRRRLPRVATCATACSPQGNDVLCVDNFFTGNKRNIAHLLGNPAFELIRHDVTFPLYVEVDQIYNLACPASPIHYQHDPVQTTKTSVHGAINMLGLAKRLRARSSRPPPARSTATRRSIRRPRTTGATSTRSASAPATTKASAAPRRCSSTTTASTSCDIKVARIFNTYGPRMHPNDGRVVSNFIVQALKGEPITIYGDGKQTRSFCYVDDLIDGFLRLMDTPDRPHRPGEPRQPRRVHHPRTGAKVIELTGSRSTLVSKPLPSGRPAAAPARHRAGARAPGLGAPGAAGRGPGEDHRLFRRAAEGRLIMCGVAGVYAYSSSAAPVDRDELRAVRDHMAARGPDGAGEWFSADGRVGLGAPAPVHHRPVRRGAQPMASADGCLVISFNGEIYNYRELRRELQARGRRFSTESDTEVLLQLYESTARPCWTSCAACSPSRSGTGASARCCWRATPSASSRCTTPTTATPCAWPRR